MAKTTVYYFASKGTGEAIRLLLAYGGQEFEDRRIEMSDWTELKPKMPFHRMPVIEIDGKRYSDSMAHASYLGHKHGLAGNTLEEDLEINQNILSFNDILAEMPFGQMPILEIDGKQYAQTRAILRYLGRKYELGGNDLEEDFEIDQNLEFYNDIRLKAVSVYNEKDEKRKVEMQEELQKNYYPLMLGKLNEIITRNNSHMALGRLTWADFMFAGAYDGFKLILSIPDIDQKYPNFKKLHDTVVNLPKVKEFCDKTPKSPF